MPKILLVIFLHAMALPCFAQLEINELQDIKGLHALVKKNFLGDGIKLLKINYKGNIEAIGSFIDHKQTTGFSKGLVLSTGRVEMIAGSNSRPNAGANFGDHFFSDEDLLTKTSQCDGAVLEIEFIPEGDSLCFSFIFGSEEYPEFVGKEFNDMFQLLLQPLFIKVKPKNLALLPNKKMININNINHLKSSEFYIDNSTPASSLYQFIEFDGLTKRLYAGARVAKGKPYKLKIMVVDLQDCEYDSGVMLEAYSLRSLSTKPRKFEVQKRLYAFNFENNKAILNKNDLIKVQKVCDSISRFAYDSIVIIGHTDNVGNADSNQVLSYNRAFYLAQLFEQKDIRCAKFISIGKGSSQPLVNNQSNKNKAINRRVEIIFYRRTK